MLATRRVQILIVTMTALVLFMVYWFVPVVRGSVGTAVSLLSRADVTPVTEYIRGFGIWASVIAVTLHLLAAVLAPLPSFVVTFATAMVFGWAWGTVISWSAAELAAGICFLMGRVYGRPLVEKVVPQGTLSWFDKFFARYGSHSVLLARLIPVVSFDFVSYGAGLTNISFWKFLVYTGLGMLPATVVYSYLASRGTSSVIWLFYAFVAVGATAVLASALRPLFERWRAARRR